MDGADYLCYWCCLLGRRISLFWSKCNPSHITGIVYQATPQKVPIMLKAFSLDTTSDTEQSILLETWTNIHLVNSTVPCDVVRSRFLGQFNFVVVCFSLLMNEPTRADKPFDVIPTNNALNVGWSMTFCKAVVNCLPAVLQSVARLWTADCSPEIRRSVTCLRNAICMPAILQHLALPWTVYWSSEFWQSKIWTVLTWSTYKVQHGLAPATSQDHAHTAAQSSSLQNLHTHRSAW